MNILLISHYAGSPKYGMEYRSYYMAKEWVKLGHNVMVVGASYSHLRKCQPQVEKEKLEGIDYLWIKTNSYKGNGLGRIFSMFLFVISLYRKIKLFINYKPEIVIASSVYTFDIYPSRKIAKKTSAKLVYEVHDLWPLSPMEIGGYSKYHPFIWLLQRGENYAYKYCHKVISMLDKSYPHMKEHGLEEKKFFCVPNGYLKSEWRNIENKILPKEYYDLFEKLHSEGKIIIGFAGGHTASTAMKVLIEAANLLNTNVHLAYVLVGDGPQKKELIQLVNSYKLLDFYFLSPISKSLIPKVVKYFDIGYMGGVHSELHKYGTSFNKMTDYMLSSIPIIMSVDEPSSVIERVGCGIQVEAENPELVRGAILKLISLSKEERLEIGLKGKKYAEKNLEYSILAKRFIDYIS